MADKREKENEEEAPKEEWEWAFLPDGRVTHGFASIVFGAAALLLFAVPYTRMLVYPFSAIGLVLAILELKPRENVKRELGMATAGASLCIAALIVAGLTLAWSNQNAEVAHAEGAAPGSKAAELGPVVYINQAGANVKIPETIPFPCGKKFRLITPSNNPDEAPKWIDASSEAAHQGEVAVAVVSVTAQRLKLKIGAGTSLLPGRNFIVSLQLVLTSTADRVDFEGWSNSSFGEGKNKPSLSDNAGNTYKVQDVGAGRQIEEFKPDLTLYPKLVANDFVIFEGARDDVEYLHLELPASAFGGTGLLRFQIPKSMIEIEAPEPSATPATVQPVDQANQKPKATS